MKNLLNIALSVAAGLIVSGCTVVEKDATPDTTVVNPPADKPDVVVTPPASSGGSTVTTGGGS